MDQAQFDAWVTSEIERARRDGSLDRAGHGIVLGRCGHRIQGCRCPARSMVPHFEVTLSGDCWRCRSAGVVKRLHTLDIEQAARQVDRHPTDQQKEAGNYRKGHLNYRGLLVTIENPRGSVRSGVDRSGEPWSIEMPHHYGYLKGTVGHDQDHLDVFIGPDPTSDRVWVVNQIEPETGKFDEHKCMLGFPSRAAAEAGYRASYADDWRGLGSMTEMTFERFREWADGKIEGPVRKANPHHGPDGRFIGGQPVPEAHLPPDLLGHQEGFQRGFEWGQQSLRRGGHDPKEVQRLSRNARDRIKLHDALADHERSLGVEVVRNDRDRARWRGVLASVEQHKHEAGQAVRKFNPNHDQSGRFASHGSSGPQETLQLKPGLQIQHGNQDQATLLVNSPAPVNRDWHRTPKGKELFAKLQVAEGNPFVDQAAAREAAAAVRESLARMTPLATEAVASWTNEIHLGSVGDVAQYVRHYTGKRHRGGFVAGFIAPRSRHLVLGDGGVPKGKKRQDYGRTDAIGVAAHEIGHIVDREIGGERRLSADREWTMAYSVEIVAARRLTRYARTNAEEGFAEFFRSAVLHPEETKRDLPKCWKFLADRGLV